MMDTKQTLCRQNFLKGIENTFKVTPRDTFRHRYNRVALYGDNDKKARTPESGEWVTGPFNVLNCNGNSSWTMATGKEFALVWEHDNADSYAQIDFIEIDYIIRKLLSFVETFLSFKCTNFLLYFKNTILLF